MLVFTINYGIYNSPSVSIQCDKYAGIAYKSIIGGIIGGVLGIVIILIAIVTYRKHKKSQHKPVQKPKGKELTLKYTQGDYVAAEEVRITLSPLIIDISESCHALGGALVFYYKPHMSIELSYYSTVSCKEEEAIEVEEDRENAMCSRVC